MKDYPALLQQREAAALYRRRRVIDSPQGVRIHSEGRELISFCSNDYLGLANDERIKKNFINGIERWGNGAGSAHMISGHSTAHHLLEEELASWLGRDRALLFSTGYMANTGIISALTGRGDLVVEDRLNHASLIDGGLNCGAKLVRYSHSDAKAAENRLANSRHKQALLATDGVFSMDGDIAPLKALRSVCQQHDALLLVDDAHGLGVLGEQGRGTLDVCALGQDDVQLLMGTLGKAFGVFGAFVAGSEALIESIIQDARSYLFSTASPAAMAEACREALKCVISDQWRRDRLASLIEYFRNGANQLGLNLMPSTTPIQPILIGEAGDALAWSMALDDLGFLVPAIRQPTVPKGSARLRITLSAEHEVTDIDRLLDGLTVAKIKAGK